MTTTPLMQSRLPRRHFLARCAVCMSAGFVPSILFARQQPPLSPSPGAPDLVDDLVAANRILAQEGVVDAYGHVSARHTRATNRFLLSRSIAPELVTAADVLEYDLEGNAVSPAGRLSYLERFIHSEIYKVRSDVNAIVHCHTPSIIPFGASTVPSSADLPHELLHRRGRAGLRHSGRRRHDRYARQGWSVGAGPRPGARR